MKFNDKLFSFPPYLSTSWVHIAALTLTNEGVITFHMNSGELIHLPELPLEQIEKIFVAHATFLENQVMMDPQVRNHRIPKMDGSEFRFAFGTIDGINTGIQHNSSQKNAPNLPEEMLIKLSEVSRILGPSDPDQLPKAEPHCNCHHCQIARALSGNQAKEIPEEEILIEELQFEQWHITQTGDKLFNVANKLDQLESYSVHLGHPIGCTCGKQNCEHILAVLRN